MNKYEFKLKIINNANIEVLADTEEDAERIIIDTFSELDEQLSSIGNMFGNTKIQNDFIILEKTDR